MREERANREKASSGNVRLPSTATEDVSRRTASLFSNEGARGWKNPKGGSKETKWGPRKPYKDREHWQIDKEALKRKFGETGWQPLKRLSPDAMEGIRALNKSDPGTFTTAVLAERFQVSPEAIRRILKSRWRPTEEEQDERTERWRKRGERIWSKLAETGVRPPKQWREMGVGRVEGGRGVVPPWKKKSRGARRQGASEAVPFSEEEFADYGSEDEDWGDRIL